jgi:hypothetical protein
VSIKVTFENLVTVSLGMSASPSMIVTDARKEIRIHRALDSVWSRFR